MPNDVKHLMIQLVQGLFSLVAAYFCFNLLDSSAEGTWEGWKLGGGIAGFLCTWFAFNYFWKNAVATESLVPAAAENNEDTNSTSDAINSHELKSAKEFIDQQVEAIECAKYYASLCIHTVHHSEKNWKAAKVNDAIKTIARRGIAVRIICGTGEKQIPGAYELESVDGVRVYHNPELLHSDLRFLKVDDHLVFLGLSKALDLDAKYNPSKEWFKINSLGLSTILEFEAKRLCTAPHTVTPYANLKKHLSGMESVRSSVIAEELMLSPVAIEELLHPREEFTEDVVVLFLGKTASGKSTLIEKLIKKYHVSSLTLDHFIIPLVNKHGNEAVSESHVYDMYDEVVETYKNGSFKIVEVATDCTLANIKRIADIAKGKGSDFLIVYCVINLEKATERNNNRSRPVPQWVAIGQNSRENHNSYAEALREISKNVLELSTDGQIIDCCDAIEKRIGEMGNKMLKGAPEDPPLI